MLNKIKLLWELFKYGKEISDKKFWKQQQAVVLPVVMAAIVSVLNLAKSFGIEIGIDENTIYWIAGSLYMAINCILTVITSKHVGLPSGTIPEAQQAMSEPLSPADDVSAQPLPSEPTAPSSSLDEDVIKRAREWVERQQASKHSAASQGNFNDTMG